MSTFGEGSTSMHAPLGAPELTDGPFRDHVYHVTLADRASIIESEGLKAHPTDIEPVVNDEKWRDKNRLLDSVRPDFVRGMNISRESALYAHTHSEIIDATFVRNTSRSFGGDRHLASVEIDVDPDKTLVCDVFLLDLIYGQKEADGSYKYSNESERNALRFWTESVTLTQLREWYDVSSDQFGLGCVIKAGAPEGLPPTFISPEVLIAGPEISPDRVRWLSSSVLALRDDFKW